MRRSLVPLLVALVALSLAGLLALQNWSAGAAVTSLQPPAQLAAGEQHTCAITSGGGVQCWGDNYYGQLGISSDTPMAAPVAVIGLESGVTALTAGDYHTCVLLTTGSVKCWGRNSFGQLGDNTTESKSTPLIPENLTSGVRDVVAGRDHTCAVTSNGGVQCWGLNNGGQLGDGTIDKRLTPVAVVGLSSGVSALAAGNMHTCALTSSGGVKCWGRNAFGQLGDGTTKEQLTPVDVLGLSSGVTALTVGNDHTCAVLNSGGVKCWGRNDTGQLGDGTTSARSAPVDVVDLSSGVRAIAAAATHTCVITDTNTVHCWGDNSIGQLGDGTAADHIRPGAVVGVSNASNALATGAWHSCVALSDGAAKCWGWNGVGQLGSGVFPNQFSPVDVVGLNNISTATAGSAHTCAVTSGGGAMCWGANFYGQIGNNTSDSQMLPVDVSGLNSGVGELVAGVEHTCALTTGGGVKCWGRNGEGQLGNNDTVSSRIPVDVVGLSSGVSLLAAGEYSTCAVSGGGVRCWGENNFGQLGDGTTTNRQTPVEVMAPGSGVTALAAGLWHTCAVTNGGGVQCWGKNDNGQLGDGTTTNRTTPVTVSGLSGVRAIAAGSWHTCAATSGGGVKCWGRNTGGQVENKPVDVVGVNDARSLGAGKYHTCALTNSGAVKCWGGNIYGQLGNGTARDSASPVDVTGLSSGISALAVGEFHNCAVTSSAGLKCWGGNTEGQLGDGSAWRPTPVAVVGLVVDPPAATTTPSPTGSATATATPTGTTPSTEAPYEPNDTCVQARPIPTDSSVQEHSFYTTGDTDWVRFDTQAHKRYRIEVQVPPASSADVDLELYPACDQLPYPSQNPSFSPNIRLDFTATQASLVFLRLTNHTATVAGAQVTYQLSVRVLDENPPDRALIILAGRLKGSDPLQRNIHHITGRIYRLFQQNGYDSRNIQYLTTDPTLPGYTAAATKENLRATITTWAVQQLEPNGVLTLYLIDHGQPDLFFIDDLSGQRVTPGELDEWLTQLESQVAGVKINVIIEACQSGSFITLPSSISRGNRLVVTSTTADADAKASYEGAYFSDHFLTGLAQGRNVYTSFFEARRIAKQLFALQEAWVDGDGDSQPNELEDAAVAASRGFHYPGTFNDPWPPHLFNVQPPTSLVNASGEVRADVRDDVKVRLVWGVVYPPDYIPPPAGQELQAEVLPTFLLSDQGDNQFAGKYTGFTQAGLYRIILHAEDNEGLAARPVVVEVNAGSRVYLPVVRR